jgi:hypothetical protein
VAYANRYARTPGTGTTFVDDNPGAGGHSYWVTAVDAAFNESNPLGPVVWP